MKRQRSRHSSDSSRSSNSVSRKKRKLQSVSYSQESSSSEEGSVVSDDWEAITEGKMKSASIEQMKLRKVLINDISHHFEKPSGHLVLKPGDTINKKYQVVKKLGEGTFGKVYRCKSLTPGVMFGTMPNDKNKAIVTKDVAIKVIRSQKKYRISAFIEINTILLMHFRQPDLQENCVPLLDWFSIGKHVCMVFPLYGESLLTYINKVRFTSMTHLRDFAWQILISLRKLHKQEIIHTDLKPENILFVKPFETGNRYSSSFLSSSDISIIDFGNSTFEGSYHTRIIGTRHYRAPEVLLGLEWSYPSDIWSVGCILMEIYTGKVMFSPKGDLEHLGMMENALGRIPSYIGRKAVREAKEYFDNDGRLWWRDILQNSESRRAVDRVSPVKKTIASKDEDFYQMVMTMLDFDPDKRCTAKEALLLPFFSRISVYRKQLQLLEATERELEFQPVRISSHGIVSKT